MDTLLVCNMCTEVFRIPVVLQKCGHSFCRCVPMRSVCVGVRVHCLGCVWFKRIKMKGVPVPGAVCHPSMHDRGLPSVARAPLDLGCGLCV